MLISNTGAETKLKPSQKILCHNGVILRLNPLNFSTNNGIKLKCFLKSLYDISSHNGEIEK